MPEPLGPRTTFVCKLESQIAMQLLIVNVNQHTNMGLGKLGQRWVRRVDHAGLLLCWLPFFASYRLCRAYRQTEDMNCIVGLVASTKPSDVVRIVSC